MKKIYINNLILHFILILVFRMFFKENNFQDFFLPCNFKESCLLKHKYTYIYLKQQIINRSIRKTILSEVLHYIVESFEC